MIIRFLRAVHEICFSSQIEKVTFTWFIRTHYWINIFRDIAHTWIVFIIQDFIVNKCGIRRKSDAFIFQDTHKKLQSHQSKNTQTEEGQNHHIFKLFDWLKQSSYNGFQSCKISNKLYNII